MVLHIVNLVNWCAIYQVAKYLSSMVDGLVLIFCIMIMNEKSTLLCHHRFTIIITNPS